MAKGTGAFHRSIAMMAAISAILRESIPMHLKDMRIGELGPYKSRGKGRGWKPSPRFDKSKGKAYPQVGQRQVERAKRQGLYMVQQRTGHWTMARLPSSTRQAGTLQRAA